MLPAFHVSCTEVGYHGQVKWTRVLELVEKRQVFLKAGIAYVPSHLLDPIVFEEFQTRLEQALDVDLFDSY